MQRRKAVSVAADAAACHKQNSGRRDGVVTLMLPKPGELGQCLKEERK